MGRLSCVINHSHVQIITISIGSFFLVSAGPAHTQDIYDGVLLESGAATPNISTEELQGVLMEHSATIVDVRTFAEYALSHIPGAVTVVGKSVSTRGEFTSDAHEIARIVNERKSAPIVIYCAGPYCGKAGRVATDLVALGYTQVRRYQLGIPVWRALGGVTEVELAGIHHVLARDKTAVFIDTRNAERFNEGTLASARNIQARYVESGSGGNEIGNAKEDGRLPMEDHNTRLIVFGHAGSDARHVAEALARNAFHNVSFFDGTYSDISTNSADLSQ